jgi:hypothetical protein
LGFVDDFEFVLTTGYGYPFASKANGMRSCVYIKKRSLKPTAIERKMTDDQTISVFDKA